MLVTAAVIAVAMFSSFQVRFYNQPLESTPLTRADLWLDLIDDLLGFEIPSTSESAPASGMEFIPQRFPHILSAIALLLIAWVHGQAGTRFILRRLNLTALERHVLILATGLGMLSLSVLLSGLAGWIAPSALAAPLALSLPLAFLPRKSATAVAPSIQPPLGTRPPPIKSAAAERRAVRWIRAAVLMVVVPFGIYLLWGAMSPQTDFDVREYHLQGPKEWFQQGRISCLPHNVYTSFPFFSEMLCLAGMALAGDWRNGALTGQLLL
ncbi:MAG: hypothetical protein ACKO2P_03920, partial [Planctomycetota bacterium]